MGALIDLPGRHFGPPTVLSLHPERDSRSSAARRPYTPQAAAASIHHRMPLTARQTTQTTITPTISPIIPSATSRRSQSRSAELFT